MGNIILSLFKSQSGKIYGNRLIWKVAEMPMDPVFCPESVCKKSALFKYNNETLIPIRNCGGSHGIISNLKKSHLKKRQIHAALQYDDSTPNPIDMNSQDESTGIVVYSTYCAILS